jgi:hypothetical protein
MKQQGCLGIYSECGLCLVAWSARGLKSLLCCLPATFLSKRKLEQRNWFLIKLFSKKFYAEANSGRVSHVSANLKSLRRSLARSASEPVVGYAKRRPSSTLGKFDATMMTEYRMNCGLKRVCHRGFACLIRVGMKTKGWLGDRGRSRIVLNRVLEYGRGSEVRKV